MNPHGTPENLKRAAGPGRAKGSKNKLTRERVELELRRLALSDPLALWEKTKGRRTFTLREIHGMSEDMRRCIASIKVRTENLTAGDGQQDTTVEVKLWDKTKALELCARSLGMLKDKIEITEGLDDRKARLRAALTRTKQGGE